jgi:hypothetical protein
MFGTERQEAGQNCTERNFITCNSCHVNRGGRGGWSIWFECKRRKFFAGLWWGNLQKDLGIGRRIILKWILKK